MRVHFSCKISNAVLTYLEDRGEDFSDIYDLAPVDIEILRDPSSWVSAPDLENFLEKINGIRLTLPNDWLQQCGWEGHRLRPWGVLDSVLRMMPKPREVFQQPERFLSYFISPAPPVENVKREGNRVSFDLPLMAEQYPKVTTYMKAAFEGIPLYVGQTQAECRWESIHLSLEWSESSQESVLREEAHSVSPQLLQSVVEELQKNQRELEARNRELQQKNQELLQVQKTTPRLTEEAAEALFNNYLSQLEFDRELPEERAHLIGQNLARLHDYLVRAQQIITLLSSTTKSPTVYKEIIRRLDWENVKLQYPRAISETVETLRSLQKSVASIQRKTTLAAEKTESDLRLREPVSLSEKDSR